MQLLVTLTYKNLSIQLSKIMGSSEKIKILHCIGSLKNGGAETQLNLIANNLSKGKYELTVMCLHADVAKSDCKGFEIIDLGYKSKLDILRIIPLIYQEIRNFDPDIVHIWLPELINVPSAIVSCLLGIPLVSTHRHSPEIRAHGIQWFRDRLRYIGHIMSSRMVINFNSKCLDGHLLKHIFRFKKGIVIPNAIDAEAIQKLGNAKSDLSIKPNLFNVVFSGRLVEQKQPMVAFQAFKMLLDEGVSCHLHIFGVGSDMSSLQKEVINSNASDFVTFHGYQDKWLSLASKADAFILPTKGEGMSNVLLEVACIGLPIVASNLPENRMLFTDGLDAILVEDSSSPEGFFKALNKIYHDATLLEKIRENAKAIPNKFSIGRMISSYDQLYSSMLEKPSI